MLGWRVKQSTFLLVMYVICYIKILGKRFSNSGSHGYQSCHPSHGKKLKMFWAAVSTAFLRTLILA